MRIVSTRAMNGKVEIDVPDAVDGEQIHAILFDEAAVRLTQEERSLLLESIASGEVDDGLDALEALDAIRLD